MRLFFLLLALNITACKHESFKTGAVIDTVACKSDPSQTYSLYIPAKNDGAVIYFFDAHGAGSLPLKKYRSLADKYGFILVGSNNSRNGNDWPTTENIWQTIAEDTRTRLKLDTSRIYTAGFSGGAKVAGYIALKFPGIRSVITNGAGLPDGTPPADMPFSITSLVGEGDLNLTDIMAFNEALDKTATRHHLILFDGKHEWASLEAMDIAFAGLKIDAGVIPEDFIAKSKARVNADINAKFLLKAAQECKLDISYLGSDAWFNGQFSSIMNDPLFMKQYQEQRDILIKEQSIKEAFTNHLNTADTAYWRNAIRGLNDGIHLPSGEGAMNQRLLAYLSLMFYSVSNHYLMANSNIIARHFVDLYQLVDPTNSEGYYFSAILYARAGDVANTEKELLRAVENGFNDKERLSQQPEFQHVDLGKIEQKMH